MPSGSGIFGSPDVFVRLLGEVASEANESSDITRAVQLALRQVSAFTGWPVAQAFTIDDDGNAHAWLSWHDPDPRWVAFERASERATLPPGVGLPGRVVSTGHAAWITDVDADGNFPRAEAAQAAGLHGAFAFPIIADGKVAAVLEYLSDVPVQPAAAFLDVVVQLGMHLGRVFERQHAQTAMARAADRLRQIINSAGEAFIGMDSTGRVSEWNHEAEDVFGWSRAEALGRRVADLVIPEEYREGHDKGLARFLATGEAKVLGQRLELTAMRRDRSLFPIELTLWSLQEGGVWHFYAFARDITVRKQVEAELARDALHDALTGLANHTALNTRLTDALNRMIRGLTPPAVLFIDLDRFKPVNDGLGHETGDQVLVTVSERLKEICRPSDLVARLAGDEFVVLLDEAPTARDATLVAARIVDAVAEPIPVGQHQVRIGASVGVALARPDSTPESLLRDADAAMYQAKAGGRGRYDIFGEQLRETVTTRLNRESELAQALDNDQFAVVYQPVFAIPERAVTGVEALLRWNHPDRGLQLPGEFIDIAEESGLIVPIGAWVFAQACDQILRWQRDPEVPEGLQIAVNLSARQLAQADLAEQVAATVDEAGLTPGDLPICLEITESVVMQDPQAAIATLSALRDLGLRIAIDDFGTGYSSLAYLKWFPVDIVKIDRSFVASLDVNRADRAIIKAVVGLARELGLTVVAEGVETAAQLEALTELGCTHAQGFLLGRPEPPSHLHDRLVETELSA